MYNDDDGDEEEVGLTKTPARLMDISGRARAPLPHHNSRSALEVGNLQQPCFVHLLGGSAAAAQVGRGGDERTPDAAGSCQWLNKIVLWKVGLHINPTMHAAEKQSAAAGHKGRVDQPVPSKVTAQQTQPPLQW